MKFRLGLLVKVAIVVTICGNALQGSSPIGGHATVTHVGTNAPDAESPSEVSEAGVIDHPQVVPIDRGTVFKRAVAGPSGALVASEPDRLIYSNTLGTSGMNFPANQPISDDIAIIAPDGCNLKRYRFKVLGKVLPTGVGGPYTVTYALYSTCPGAMGSTNTARDLVKIPGTDGVISFEDEAPREIEHVVDPLNPVTIPTNFYLGMRFNRANCGTVLGAPALIGFSGDIWDFPGFPCNGFLGGFSQLPHASFWAEFFGDSSCDEAHLGYKCARASGPIATIGANVQGVDDVSLIVDECEMIGYEVVVRGVGFYSFDLRRECDGDVIEGTQRTFQINDGATPLLQVARFTFDPPIALPQRFFVGFKSSSNNSGVGIAGILPVVGESSVEYFTIGIDGCQPQFPTQGIHGAINFAITCDGAPPLGACCDNNMRDEKGEAQCRELPEVNCFACASVPSASEQYLCPWIEGVSCDPDPFPHACGLGACCKPDDTCENLTKNQCNAVEPLERPRLWQYGSFCYESEYACPFNACLARQGDCLRVHPGTGCSDPFCCHEVCDFDSWCCLVEWDEICLRWADDSCTRAPGNDQCAADFPVRGFAGAFEIPIPGALFGTNTAATVNLTDSGFCCHEGTGTCEGGPYAGEICLTSTDCPIVGTCIGLEPMPGNDGNGTVWHKFVATHTTARISTCGSENVDSRFSDSLIQVFAAGDPTTSLTACNSLSPIGCNDDAGAACPDEPHNSVICVGGLVPGETYYILLGSKMPKFQGRYRIELSAPCVPEPAISGDSCFQANTATNGITPFDTTGATFECPAAACSPLAQNDIWWNYTATCTGEATFSTCGPGNPNTNIAVYEGCDTCPTVSNPDGFLACNQDGNQAGCVLPARVTIPVALGQCFKIRVADQEGFPVSGDLTITCDCQPNGVPDDQDIAGCDQADFYCRDCNVNGILDGCDIRDNFLLDLNNNGRIDECETCPSGLVAMLDPPYGVVDARRPLAPENPIELQGIDFVRMATFSGADASCWSLCETNLNAALHPPYPQNLVQNEIVMVVEEQPGEYGLQLKRPITPGETTRIIYTDEFGETSSFPLTAHPGNVDANFVTHPADLVMLIDVLNGTSSARWGFFSTDCDHSGLTAPADILCVIDLLNQGWNGIARPPVSANCP